MTAVIAPPVRPSTAPEVPASAPTGTRGATLRRLAWVGGAAALSLVVTVQQLRDPDVWWHLAVGRLITHDGIPAAEPFTFAGAPHPWIGQQWLYEVGLSRAVDLGGAGLAMVVMGALGSLAFAIAALSLRPGERVGGAPLAASTVFGAFLAGEVLGVRGQVITVLGTALTLLVVTRWRSGSTRATWALVPLLAIWANLHAGFVAGLALPLVAAAVVAVHRRNGGDEPARVGPLVGVTALAGLATALNPAGPRLWTYVAQTFTTPTLTQSIAEWQSPDFHTLVMRLLEATALVLVALWVASRRADPLDVTLAIGSLAATFQAQRNLALFAVVVTPQLARYGTSAWRSTRLANELPPRLRRALARPYPAAGAAAVALAVSVAALVVDVLPAARSPVTAAWERDNEPEAAVSFVAAHLDGHHIYSTYEWGGYLAERLPNRRAVWIYGESAVFGEERLQEYLDVHLLRPDWDTVLRRHAMDTAIVPSSSQEAGAMLSTGWGVLCRDTSAGALVLARSGGGSGSGPADPGGAPRC